MQTGGMRRPIVVQTSAIAHYSPSGASSTSVTLTDGTELLAVVPYATLRDAVYTVRNQFISLVPATTA